MKIFLYPLAAVYNFMSELNRKFTKPVKLCKPVISVGNITWGGSAKTPVVTAAAKYILSLNKTPVVLSRGYGRKIAAENPVIVRDKNSIISSLEMSGDEPFMMAQQIACPVIISPDRAASAEAAGRFNPDVFILDDGFQHWKLERDLDIVCVNAANPFGNEMIIPAGILRESLDALKRAGIIIITNSDLVPEERLESLDRRIYDITGKKSLRTSYGNFKLKNMYDNSFSKPEIFNKNIFTVCAIGSPDNFRNSIIKLGLKIKKEFVFRDHYGYSANDIEKIYKQMSDSDVILTTEKDGIKIKEIINGEIKKKIFILSGEIVFNFGKEKFEEKIAEILR